MALGRKLERVCNKGDLVRGVGHQGLVPRGAVGCPLTRFMARSVPMLNLVMRGQSHRYKGTTVCSG